jgi:hypothetical protein
MIYPVFIPETDDRAHAANQYGPAPDFDFECRTEIHWLGNGWLICCGTPSGPEEPSPEFFRVRVYSFAADGTPVYEGQCPLHQCFPDDDEAQVAALRDFACGIHHMVGGGAAPLSMLVPIHE